MEKKKKNLIGFFPVNSLLKKPQNTKPKNLSRLDEEELQTKFNFFFFAQLSHSIIHLDD